MKKIGAIGISPSAGMTPVVSAVAAMSERIIDVEKRWNESVIDARKISGISFERDATAVVSAISHIDKVTLDLAKKIGLRYRDKKSKLDVVGVVESANDGVLSSAVDIIFSRIAELEKHMPKKIGTKEEQTDVAIPDEELDEAVSIGSSQQMKGHCWQTYTSECIGGAWTIPVKSGRPFCIDDEEAAERGWVSGVWDCDDLYGIARCHVMGEPCDIDFAECNQEQVFVEPDLPICACYKHRCITTWRLTVQFTIEKLNGITKDMYVDVSALIGADLSDVDEDDIETSFKGQVYQCDGFCVYYGDDHSLVPATLPYGAARLSFSSMTEDEAGRYVEGETYGLSLIIEYFWHSNTKEFCVPAFALMDRCSIWGSTAGGDSAVADISGYTAYAELIDTASVSGDNTAEELLNELPEDLR